MASDMSIGEYHFTIEEQSSILLLQQSVLEMVTTNCSDESILNKICELAENLLPYSVATIMTRQPEGHLDILCAPSVPPEGVASLNGLIPSKRGGSCGNAVYNNEPTFIIDIQTDQRALDTREVLGEFGICSCWSNPIRNRQSQAIGSFALSSFEIREPGEFHQQLLSLCAHLVGIILERQRQNQQLEVLAYSDPLTGLANRISLFNQIANAIEAAKKEQSTLALLFLDLDKFKQLNDTFGHSVGDDVLVMVAQRIREECVGTNDVLARVGGDEFVILVCEVTSIDAIKERALSILNKIREPILYQEYEFLIDGSVGISSYPDHGDSVEHLIKRADTAMYHAKRHEYDRVSVYDSSL